MRIINIFRKIQASLVFFVLSAPLWAQPSPSGPPPTLTEDTPRQIREDLQILQKELVRIESEFDAYNPAIAEISIDLAERLAERGNYSDALVSYRRALHVLRINEGLSSDRQIPILENILETHYLAGQYQQAGESLERLSALYSKNYDRMNPEMIPHLISRGDWHLGAYYFGFGRSNLQHLVEAHNAYSRVAEIRESSEMPYDPHIYRALSAVNYNMAIYVERADNQNLVGGSDTREGTAVLSGFAGNSYRRGKSQLENGLAAAQRSTNQDDVILALVQLADWEQLFRKRFSARDKYIEAYLKTQELEPEHELFSLFSNPKLLPAFEISERINPPSSKEAKAISLIMDISAWGTSRNVKVERPEDEASKHLRAERAALRTANSSIFRPTIVGGEPVKSENVSQTVVIPI